MTEENKNTEQQCDIHVVMRCFDIKIDEIKNSIKYDVKYFGGDSVRGLTDRLKALEDLKQLIDMSLENCA